MLPPVLTLLQLGLAVALGLWRWNLRRALPALVMAWAAVMTTSFVVAGVADDGDVGTFIGSAVVILALSLLLWKLGMWFALRRTDQRSG